MSTSGRVSSAVSVRGLVKRFDKRVAVNRISFDVGAGEIFALLGPNGAGKSTTMKILSTLSLPTAGAAYISGLDVVRQAREVRRRIGLVFQEPSLDRQLTLAENLRLHAVMYGVRRRDVDSRVQYALDLIGLTPYRDELAARLSGGMSRRLEIGRALLHKPDVLFLDEPTIGLDPPNRARIWGEVLRLRALTGLTVLMTTHYMDEVEHADRIAIVNGGEIVAIDTPANLKAAVGMDRVQLRTADDRRTVRLLSAAEISAWTENGGVTVYLPFAERELSFLLSLLDVPVSYVNVQRPTLDDVFLHFTEQSFQDGARSPRRPASQPGRTPS